MIVTIKQYGNRFDVSTGDSKIHILNLNSLVYHLKKVLKLNASQRADVFEALQTTNEVQIQRVSA